MTRFLLETLAVLGVLCGAGFYVAALWSVRSFRRGLRSAAASFAPPVSILKPLRGMDREAYESFRSHCLLDYPEYELIFGVSDAHDPAANAVRHLQAEFPHLAIKLVLCPKMQGTNHKVSTLTQMLPAASHRYLLVNDSDIRVPRDYLRRVLRHFERPGVGMVTCLYRGVAAATLSSRLEAIGISTEFMPGVLVARQIEGGVRFALGSTLAFTRESLAAIGGLESLVDYLADDFELGSRIAEAGFEVVLSDPVVENYLPDYSFAAMFQHQLRWGRSTRHSRPWGYGGLLFTFAIPWALLALFLSHGAPWAWALFSVAAALRLAVALAVGLVVLGDRQVLRDLWLLPVRDLLGLAVWIGSYTGSTVAWRGDKFILKDRKLLPVGGEGTEVPLS